MSWFNTDGKMSENILFSKFTYTRNLSGLLFSGNQPKQISDIITRAESILKKNGFHTYKIQKAAKNTALSYCEKQYVEQDFCSFPYDKAIFFNEPCSLSISVGGSNLINIYAILPGASVRDAYKISSSAEELLDAEFDFAYDESLGYLSPVPNMCGSGIRISCALYLPLLSQANKIPSLCRSLSELGISLYPIFSQSSSGDIYIMTYSPPMSADEETSVDMFEGLMLDVISLEKEELKALGEDKIFNIAERGSRALGILAYAHSLTEDELISLTSDIRLCLSAGCDEKLIKSVAPSVINSIMFDSLSYSVLANSRNKIKSKSDLDAERATQMRKLINSLPEKNALIST